MLRRSNRASLDKRLAALEAKAAARHGGPMIGIEDAATGEIKADGGRVFATADEFFEAGRRGKKLPLLIALDREPSPYNRPAVPEDGPK